MHVGECVKRECKEIIDYFFGAMEHQRGTNLPVSESGYSSLKHHGRKRYQPNAPNSMRASKDEMPREHHHLDKASEAQTLQGQGRILRADGITP
jgi:hypothetical protein